MIQVHRAWIAHLTRSRRQDRGSEIADRMNAIALLCDRGRTELGRALARQLAEMDRDASEPIVTELFASEPATAGGRTAWRLLQERDEGRLRRE